MYPGQNETVGLRTMVSLKQMCDCPVGTTKTLLISIDKKKVPTVVVFEW